MVCRNLQINSQLYFIYLLKCSCSSSFKQKLKNKPSCEALSLHEERVKVLNVYGNKSLLYIGKQLMALHDEGMKDTQLSVPND